MSHIPVLLQEVLEALRPKDGDFVIDGTLGSGGHANEIIKRIAPTGTFLGIDRDPQSIANFSSHGHTQSVHVYVKNETYAHVPEVISELHLPQADGLLLDLGFSSEQLSDGSFAGRGFSFSADEPLIMTYDDRTEPLREQLRAVSVQQLTQILREFGEERNAFPIAQAIERRVKQAKMQTTADLVAAVAEVSTRRGKLHPATLTFQALRIWANRELDQLTQVLDALHQIVKPGGRVAIISFHSLEDRIVKNYFRAYSRGQRYSAESDAEGVSSGELPNTGVRASTLITKKPITATAAEIARNPRSRSAKLRILEL
jgi:16S rRNA (cytosine1402-N4)-methyltransferase